MDDKALIFNIQHYSLHDGPGIRTVVFFKGCPMRCSWCCNPESQSFKREISYSSAGCIGKAACGFCKEECPQGAISFGGRAGRAQVDFSRCSGCLSCALACPARALKVEGREYETEEILDIVQKDQAFYKRGGGGLTVSGGEALAQPRALLSLLGGARKRYLHTAMESCGQADYEILHEAAYYLDFLYYDIKTLDDEKHRSFTLCGNKRILENIKRLIRDYPDLPVIIRTPVIPGFNDTKKELEEISAFVKGTGCAGHELLAYHSFGKGKYASLGRKYEVAHEKLGSEMLGYIEKYNSAAASFSRTGAD